MDHQLMMNEMYLFCFTLMAVFVWYAAYDVAENRYINI